MKKLLFALALGLAACGQNSTPVVGQPYSYPQYQAVNVGYPYSCQYYPYPGNYYSNCGGSWSWYREAEFPRRWRR